MSDNPPKKRAGDRQTVSIHALVTPKTAEAFRLWAAKRGLNASAAVRTLVVDALVRELTSAPLGALYSELPPEMADRIVAELGARESSPPE